MMNESCEFGSCHLLEFAEAYAPIHQPLALLVCCCGILSNTVNVMVLTKKNMRTSTNSLLTGLSVAQLLLVTNYCILQFFEMAREACNPAVWTHNGTAFKYVNVNMNIFFHSVAFAHTVSLALFRYVAVKWPVHAQKWLKVPFARKWTLALFVFFILFCIPQYFCIGIEKIPSHWHNCSGTLGKNAAQYDLVWSENQSLRNTAFWLFGISFKLLPCFLMTFLSSGLILSIRKRERRKMFLLGRPPPSRTEINEEDKISNEHITTAAPLSRTTTYDSSTNKSRNIFRVRTRTTRMLIATVFLCVSVELPHGIINLMVAIYGERFAMTVYDNLGDMLEMLTLLYSSVNFILYCTMSTDFRKTFLQLQLVTKLKSILNRDRIRKCFWPSRVMNHQQNLQNSSESGDITKSTGLSLRNRVRRFGSRSSRGKSSEKYLVPKGKLTKTEIEVPSGSPSSSCLVQHSSNRSLSAKESSV